VRLQEDLDAAADHADCLGRLDVGLNIELAGRGGGSGGCESLAKCSV